MLAEASALNGGSGGGAVTLNDVNPVWLCPPVAPYAAARIEGRMVDVALVREKFAQLRAAHAAVIVEGAGGWLVPVTRDFSMADLAAEFALPVLVVAANRLGVINHTLLTVAAIHARGLRCAGVIFESSAVASRRRCGGGDECGCAQGIAGCAAARRNRVRRK